MNEAVAIATFLTSAMYQFIIRSVERRNGYDRDYRRNDGYYRSNNYRDNYDSYRSGYNDYDRRGDRGSFSTYDRYVNRRDRSYDRLGGGRRDGNG